MIERMFTLGSVMEPPGATPNVPGMPQPPADDLRRSASVEDLHGLARDRLAH